MLELLVRIDSIIGMMPAEMRLKPFNDKLDLMPESFGRNTGLTFSIGYFDSKGFGSSGDDLLNLRQRFVIHNSTPRQKPF